MTPAEAITPEPATRDQVQSVFGRSALLVTRRIEWFSVLLGYEQVRQYQVLDERGSKVAVIAEAATHAGNWFARQILRTKRTLKACVLNADGTRILMRIHRPAHLITSKMHINDGSGQELGEVHQEWHPYRRVYRLYLSKRQFATINTVMMGWGFELKAKEGGTLGLIDRNFLGVLKEFTTDAAKYVVHFGVTGVEAAAMMKLPPISRLARLSTGAKIIPSGSGELLDVARELSAEERMVVLACAVAIDADHFSHGSWTKGLLFSALRDEEQQQQQQRPQTEQQDSRQPEPRITVDPHHVDRHDVDRHHGDTSGLRPGSGQHDDDHHHHEQGIMWHVLRKKKSLKDDGED